MLNKNIFGYQAYIALLSILAIFAFLILRFLTPELQAYADYPLYVALTLGGIPLLYDLTRKLIAREFSSDLLAGISIVTAIILEQYLAGTLVVLMLSGGESLERYAVRTASKVLEALAKRAPTIAHRKTGKEIEDILTDQICVNDLLIIFPHEICPVDGEVIEGHGVMDESYLTGEPFMISKAPGSSVLSGAINEDSSLTIRATKLAGQSRYAKIMQVMKESEQRRPRIRRLADTLGAWYTPLAVAIALLAWAISGEAVRFLSVLVVATPCPLLLAIPVAIIGSISLSASRGILIKDPVVLEQLQQCKTMILDKTGTLTYGKPTLTEQTLYIKGDSKEVLKLVASAERYSKHPLSSAILERASEEKIELAEAQQISEQKGLGLKGKVLGHEVFITSRKQLSQDQIALLPPSISGLECIVLIDGVLAARYRFHDAPRAESHSFIQHLTPKHGFEKIMLVSGDREEEVRYLANQVGISEVYASQSPEDKVKIVEAERKKAKTAFLGDGINDAPAMFAATVGIAFGQNSDITAEAAGAVVLENSLEKVDEFIHISQRMRRIALQSAVGGMALSIFGMGFAAFGFLLPVAGALLQEVIDVIAILNSLRTIKRPTRLSDMDL